MKKYLDRNLTINERVDALIAEMTIGEKVTQCMHESPAVERLSIPAYNWWNECLHGVARAGLATVFPQAVALAATFDPELLFRIGETIALEARAKHFEHARHGDRTIYKGLTFWSPNVNIFRDPRWGRGHETYGEDPYLTARLGVAFVKGLQGDDTERLKVCATPKHFAVHSGPEGCRLQFNVEPSEQDLRETYLPAFRACVREGGAASIMGAYNAIGGQPCCMNGRLLTDILRKEWGFDGCVVSDAGAVSAIHGQHRYFSSQPESAAASLKAGLDLITGGENGLLEALDKGLITEKEIDNALRNLFKVRFRLGMFDDPATVPLADTPYEITGCLKHRKLAIDAARKSVVLLKNENGILPLKKNLKSVAVIGPNADCRDVLLGNYNGTPGYYCTPLEAIRRALEPKSRVWYAKGCELQNPVSESCAGKYDMITEAVIAAERSDIAILFMGLSPRIEGEAGDAFNSEASGDKTSLELPEVQRMLVEKVIETGTPVILVLISGSALTTLKFGDRIPGILQGWYPGAEGGIAIAEILFGDCSPSGRLPVTFYKTTEELPPFEDYSMEGRTYRFMRTEPLYPFGYGLSYTSFKYSGLKLNSDVISTGESLSLCVSVKNTGKRDGEEVVQVYLKKNDSRFRVPNCQLAGVKRIGLKAGKKAKVKFVISPEQMLVFDGQGREVFEPGVFELSVGGSQPDARSEQLTGVIPMRTHFECR